MDHKKILEQVILFATRAHGEQKRKYTPEPYIVHPIRVMELCRREGGDVCILSAAVLHDVLEDTPATEDQLLSFLRAVMPGDMATRTTALVVELTDVYTKKNYPRFNRRERKEMERARVEKTSPDSQTIRYADIIDNCREITVQDPAFARVFLSECRALLKKIRGGNPALFTEAKNLVENALQASKKTRSAG